MDLRSTDDKGFSIMMVEYRNPLYIGMGIPIQEQKMNGMESVGPPSELHKKNYEL